MVRDTVKFMVTLTGGQVTTKPRYQQPKYRNMRARYVPRHPCEDKVACPVCSAPVGSPCYTPKKAMTQSHTARRDAYNLLEWEAFQEEDA